MIIMMNKTVCSLGTKNIQLVFCNIFIANLNILPHPELYPWSKIVLQNKFYKFHFHS